MKHHIIKTTLILGKKRVASGIPPFDTQNIEVERNLLKQGFVTGVNFAYETDEPYNPLPQP